MVKQSGRYILLFESNKEFKIGSYFSITIYMRISMILMDVRNYLNIQDGSLQEKGKEERRSEEETERRRKRKKRHNTRTHTHINIYLLECSLIVTKLFFTVQWSIVKSFFNLVLESAYTSTNYNKNI